MSIGASGGGPCVVGLVYSCTTVLHIHRKRANNSVTIMAQGIGVAHPRFLWGSAHTYALGHSSAEPSWLSGGVVAGTRPCPLVTRPLRRCWRPPSSTACSSASTGTSRHSSTSCTRRAPWQFTTAARRLLVWRNTMAWLLKTPPPGQKLFRNL